MDTAESFWEGYHPYPLNTLDDPRPAAWQILAHADRWKWDRAATYKVLVAAPLDQFPPLPAPDNPIGRALVERNRARWRNPGVRQLLGDIAAGAW